MVFKILFWSIIVYITLIILWRLFISIGLIIEGYQTNGVKGGFLGFLGALILNLLMLLRDIWGFLKYAIGVLIAILIIRACSH